MNGPGHYRVAEQLLSDVTQVSHYGPHVITVENGSAVLAAAQVHATLALAAATAVGKLSEMPVRDGDAWQDTAGIQPHPEVAA